MISAPTACQLKGLARTINNDNFRWGQRLETLHANMAKTASSNYHSSRPRIKDARSFLNSMIGGQTSISQGRNVFGSEIGIQLDNGACCRLQEISHAAIGRDTRKGAISTVHIISRTASAAQAAGDKWMNNDHVTNRNIADRRSNLLN